MPRPRDTGALRRPPAALPVLRPMTQPEYDVWLAEAIPVYAADKVTSGRWDADESLELARGEFAQLLPHGLHTDDHHLLTIVGARGQAVGSLWFGKAPRAGGNIAYVYDLVVRPRYRRRGHATRAFMALETEVRRLGWAGIALHVFGHNVGAQALYAKLGYRPTNINLFKPVEPAPNAAARRSMARPANGRSAPARKRVVAVVA